MSSSFALCSNSIVLQKINETLKLLDEVQEKNYNHTKKLPLGNTPSSWKTHSPNVMFAHQAMNSEKCEFIKYRINYEDVGDGVDEFNSRAIMSTSAVVERKKIEMSRLHEFCVLTFFRDSPTTLINDEPVEKNIENVTTDFAQDASQKDIEKDALEEFVGEIFTCSDHKDTTNENLMIIDEENNHIADSNAEEDANENDESITMPKKLYPHAWNNILDNS